LTTELSAATAQLAALQLELGGARQQEAELKSQLATITAEAQSNSQEWDTSRRQIEGMSEFPSKVEKCYVDFYESSDL